MKAISRRTALRYGASGLAAMAMSTILPRPAMARSLAKQPGLQLYTVGKELTADMHGTLASVANMGYREVESAGMGGKSAREFRKALDAAGLKCQSSHMFLAPGQTPAQFFEDARALGSEYVVSSFLIPPSVPIKSAEDYFRFAGSLTQDDYLRMAGEINELARLAKSTGLTFAYHNHNAEFRKWDDGSTGYDVLMSGTDPDLVKIEVDCGWADLGGRPPVQLFKQYAGRVHMLHIKDCVAIDHPVVAMDQNPGIEWTLLGQGHMDYRAILAAAPAAGVERIFVEQEPPYVKFTALEAAKANIAYLRSLG